ncbi:MAG: DUF1902 domain-containing protein [Gammaproteobacteria bacterium]|nr:DUF1902 domain-containing protein [Gammaproteobacteria bacterium]
MKVTNLLLRCYAEQKDDQWSLVCVDLSLAAQADSFEEVKLKFDAMDGEDKEHVVSLLSRKAPLSQWIKYYWFKCKYDMDMLQGHAHEGSFKEALPLTPCHH